MSFSTDFDVGGKPLEYRFYAEAEDQYVTRNGYDSTFKISKSDYDRICGYSGAQIVQRPESTKEKEDSSAS